MTPALTWLVNCAVKHGPERLCWALKHVFYCRYPLEQATDAFKVLLDRRCEAAQLCAGWVAVQHERMPMVMPVPARMCD